MRTFSRNGIKCKLKKGKWIDINVICDILIQMTNRRKATGFIKTSKPLPIEDEFSNFVSGETFEIWFEEPILDTPGLKVRLSNIDHKTKKRASFESWGPLHK